MSFGFIEIPKTVESIAWWIAGTLGIGVGLHKFFKSRIKTDNFIQIHSEINERLTELRVESNAMRASILQFHNGEYYMDGISMRKFSVSHESSHKGYASQVLKFKNTLCSLFVTLLSKVMENNPIIHSVESMDLMGHSRHFFEDEFISHYAVLPLKNKGIAVGFVLIQWHKDYPPTLNQEEKLINDFKDIRNSIEIQLSHQKN
jgi:hypothetical protein